MWHLRRGISSLEIRSEAILEKVLYRTWTDKWLAHGLDMCGTVYGSHLDLVDDLIFGCVDIPRVHDGHDIGFRALDMGDSRP